MNWLSYGPDFCAQEGVFLLTVHHIGENAYTWSINTGSSLLWRSPCPLSSVKAAQDDAKQKLGIELTLILSRLK